MHYEVPLPALGESVPEATVGRILVEVGDLLKIDQIYAIVHTDKVDIELPSTVAGVVQDIKARPGQVIPVRGVILVVDSDIDPVEAGKCAERANVSAGLIYLSKKDANYLCCRPELGQKLRFDDYKSFVEEVISIARGIQLLPWHSLDGQMLEDLKDGLFNVTDLVKELVGFDPAKLSSAKTAKHDTVSQLLKNRQDRALRDFSDILVRAREQLGLRAEALPKGWIHLGHEKAYVFISYSHVDEREAEDLARRLKNAGIQYFLSSEGVSLGSDIEKSVADALNHATHIVVLLSPAKSSWIHFEVGYAKAKGIVLIPYLLHNSTEVPAFLSKNRYIIRDRASINSLITMLLNYVKPWTSSREGQSYFSEWNGNLARERIKTANSEIWQQAVNSYTFLNEARQVLAEFIQRGGKFRCLLVDPYGEAIQMVTRRNVGPDKRLANVMTEIELARQILNDIAGKKRSSVELRVVDHLPEPVMTIVDPGTSGGTMFVTLNGFEKRLGSRPSFILSKEHDSKWFEFYQESFENLWGHDICRKVDLGKSLSDRRK